MDLLDIIDENGLQKDEWSLTRPKFGKQGQLEVVGWSGKSKGDKLYILKCTECSEDVELFGTGHFKSRKYTLTGGGLPCGCSNNPRWSEKQYKIICSRKAESLGYKFVSFNGDWKGKTTKIRMLCSTHGEWSSGTIDNLVSKSVGCPRCGDGRVSKARTKSDDLMIKSFFKSKAFHPDTKFWRSERLIKSGYKKHWHMYCPRCGETGESVSESLQKGYLSCACGLRRQQEAYINLILDGNVIVALKFGIAVNSSIRIKRQALHLVYDIEQHGVYLFPTIESCKKAEDECKQELDCGIVLKRDMPDGYTETTWVYNLEKIIEIYERNGGNLQENT